MDYREFNNKLGKSIRTFRKLQHLTQKDLAQKLNKSLACISKYENGSISIDLFTLYEIASALEIPPQLLYPQYESVFPVTSSAIVLPTIFRHSPLYFYVYLGEEKRIITCVMNIHSDNLHVTLYIDLQVPSDYNSCKYILNGTIYCSEVNISIFCINPLLAADFMLLYFPVIGILQKKNIGVCTALNPLYRYRTLKCYLCTSPISNIEHLISMLSFTKEEIYYMKKYHSLLI